MSKFSGDGATGSLMEIRSERGLRATPLEIVLRRFGEDDIADGAVAIEAD